MIKDFCHLSKNLYNYANFILRQEFIANKSILKEYDLSKTLANYNQIDYRALPAQTAQQTIKLLMLTQMEP
jgi:putative transposase